MGKEIVSSLALVAMVTPTVVSHATPHDSARRLRVRPIRPSDRPGIERLFERGITADDRQLRFHGAQLDWRKVEMAMPDATRGDAAYVVVRGDELLGIGRLFNARPGGVAEFSLSVNSHAQRQGIGRRLLSRLVGDSQASKVDRLLGDVLSYNPGMRGLARSLGFVEHREPDDPTSVIVQLDALQLRDWSEPKPR